LSADGVECLDFVDFGLACFLGLVSHGFGHELDCADLLFDVYFFAFWFVCLDFGQDDF
jgi:hypothetical protein